MANSEFPIQGLTSKSADAEQAVVSASDVGAYSRVTVHVQRVTAAATGSVLILQTAASNSASRYVDLAPAIDLSKTGDIEHTYNDIARFVRWKVLIPSGTAQFAINAIAREV